MVPLGHEYLPLDLRRFSGEEFAHSAAIFSNCAGLVKSRPEWRRWDYLSRRCSGRWPGRLLRGVEDGSSPSDGCGPIPGPRPTSRWRWPSRGGGRTGTVRNFVRRLGMIEAKEPDNAVTQFDDLKKALAERVVNAKMDPSLGRGSRRRSSITHIIDRAPRAASRRISWNPPGRRLCRLQRSLRSPGEGRDRSLEAACWSHVIHPR